MSISSQQLLQTHQRQIHLDFHTSPFIPDVGSEFDAQEFAQTLQAAYVNSTTVFAKCHHGMCYYPTTTGTPHPALKGRDLLGEQIEALHRVGIRAPIYTTIAWEEDAAARFPLWRQLKRDGSFANIELSTDERTRQPGGWKYLNIVHPDYYDYIEAHITEILDRYGDAVDGFFFDIVMNHWEGDWSDAAVKYRQEWNLMGADRETHDRFETAAQAHFAQHFTRLVRSKRPDATLFYNAASHFFSDSSAGAKVRVPFQSHFEVESLASGFWGYDHFPRVARLVMNWKQEGGDALPWLAMTGRFQKQWGDFGGHKPPAALEFECFRAQALGGAMSVGDQLPPRGTLDAAAYQLIGGAYAQWEKAEPFYSGSTPFFQLAVVCPNYPGRDEIFTGKSEEGAVRIAEEAQYQYAMADDSSDLKAYELLILPDALVITEQLKHKLADFYANGGQLVLSHRAGFDANSNWALDFLPLQFEGEAAKWPTFWRANANFDADLALSDRVMYERGLNVTGQNLEVLAQRVLPYFQRTDTHFCSHFQTPPQKEADAFPAIVAGERFVYFADPIFREYRQSGNLAARDGVRAALARLLGPPAVGAGLPTTVSSIARRRDNDLLLTLLHYIPIRKALDIDVVEERSSFAGELLCFTKNVPMVIDFQSGEALPRLDDHTFALPIQKGRLLLEVPGYFL